MAFPNFLVIGTQRSGTTALYHYLQQHPQIYLYSERKELNFFIHMAQQGLPFEQYQTYFAKRAAQPFAGDISPGYLYHHAEVVPLIKANLPNVKLITILRHPVDRAYSSYCLCMGTKREWQTFEAAWERKAVDSDLLNYKYVSSYAAGLKAYTDCFDREQMLFLTFDEFVREPTRTLRQIYDFLGADSTFQNSLIDPTDRKSHAAQYPRFPGVTRNLVALRNAIKCRPRVRWAISWPNALLDWLPVQPGYPNLADETRRKLNRYFAGEFDTISELTGLDLSSWQRD